MTYKKIKMLPDARAARTEFKRAWNKRNPKRRKGYIARYWVQTEFEKNKPGKDGGGFVL